MAGGRRAALAITAVALVAGVLVALSQDEAVPAAASSPAVFQRLAEASSSDGSRLRLASLPKFSPAALALQHNQVEAASIVVSKKQELTAGKATNSSTVAAAGAKAALGAKKLAAKAKSAGADALGFLSDGMSKKKLAKIEAAARGAALKENQALFAADDALAASQKELGSSAVNLRLLTRKRAASKGGGREATTSADMSDLITVAGQDKGASTALAAATKAAKHNSDLMKEARQEEADSAKILGKDAESFPSLGDASGAPDSLHGAEGSAKGMAALAHSASGVGRASEARSEAAEREFITATRYARSRP